MLIVGTLSLLHSDSLKIENIDNHSTIQEIFPDWIVFISKDRGMRVTKQPIYRFYLSLYMIPRTLSLIRTFLQS